MKIYKFKTLLYLKRGDVNKQGKAPVMGRITLNNSVVQFSTKISCTPELWNPRESRLNGKSKEAVETNVKIEKVLLAVSTAFDSLIRRNTDFTAQSIKELMQGSMNTQMTLMQMGRRVTDDIRNRVGIDYKKSTVSNYEYTCSRLEAFIRKKFKTDDLAFGQLNEQFIRDFKDYCMDDCGLANETVRHYLAILKKFCHLAFKEGHADRWYFERYSLPKQKVTTPRALCREDFEKVRDYEIDPVKHPSLALTRDLFLFACYAGTPYADVVTITDENLSRDSDGSLWLRYRRKKNEMLANVKLLPEAVALLEKYRDTKRPTLFPPQKYDTVRANMKVLCVWTGIPMSISFHSGRHSFASLIALEEGVPVETISRMLGHSNIVTTQVYARVTPRKLFEDMAKFAEATKDMTLVL